MSGLIWLHEDALRSDHPVFAAAGDGSPAFFVWDDAYLQAMDYGFKRLVFIYESLVELPVTILHGDQQTCLARLARQHGGSIYVPATPNQLLQNRIEHLQRDFDVVEVADTPFVELAREPDLGRFFRYWNKARKAAMSRGGGR
ncbi:MAG: hypothetical protein QNJ85_16285 [Gammaproteobacteria bacterium]|nr:hypothetical protein [Gammaproteobacteria bacterium]